MIMLSGCAGNGSNDPSGRSDETAAQVLAAYDLPLPECARQAASFWDSPDNLNRSLVYRGAVDLSCLEQALAVVGVDRGELLPYTQLPAWSGSIGERLPSAEIVGTTTIVPAAASRKEMQVDVHLVESSPALLFLHAIYP
ncbi:MULTISPECIES: hypothetical protein [unclassified Micromonospora]|uniref:hypothetical protein n=1 Tax=unclassified Micromonospora TaxID=2617518 RepID=UPI0033B0655A